MNNERIITLTTDFGYKDPFVAEMKGVILSINPATVIVDITHDIRPHDIEEGAFVIGSSYKYFPKGTIHICIVDPGVGSERRAVILEAEGHYFVGPDNGIFSYAMHSLKNLKAIHITEDKYMLSKDSPTFQGRDVFAPVAAWLSKGLKMEEFGFLIDDFKRFEIPLPEIEGRAITGKVIYIDRFGNAITNINKNDISLPDVFSIEVKGKNVYHVKHYSQAIDKNLSSLFNSSGYLELFVNMNNASQMFDIKKGDVVTIHC